jgi:hypothetical protein
LRRRITHGFLPFSLAHNNNNTYNFALASLNLEEFSFSQVFFATMIVSDVVAVGVHMNECACRHILTPFFKPPVSSSSSCESGILADFSLFLPHNNNLAFASTELEEFSFCQVLFAMMLSDVVAAPVCT